MSNAPAAAGTELDPKLNEIETQEWLESLDYVVRHSGRERAQQLLEKLQFHARQLGVTIPYHANTPYINTIPPAKQPPFPGSHDIEQRIRNMLRWNAVIMVLRTNRDDPTLGGHISTYASAATLIEIALNHFVRGGDDGKGDLVYFQPHAAPGIYARAYLEGRLSEEQLNNYRRELRPGGGLSSYPHPWLMPDFWQFPSASMGLSPINAIYQARFNRYLEDRGLAETADQRIWSFIGDGETDEPECLGAISLAAREQLDNLIFVVNCNLQRLDGPVRGNGKIIQELERGFRGAGWNVIKVIWGSGWDPMLAMDDEGLLVRRMGEIVDGQYQKYTVSSGSYGREHFFGTDPKLREMSRLLTDEQIRTIRRGGHDPDKVYAAYKAAVDHRGSPSVILAKTIKGYGIGEAGEGTMTTHQLKALDLDVLRQVRTRFGIPISDEAVAELPFYRPPEDSPEIQYLRERRQALGGYVPRRVARTTNLKAPKDELFGEFATGTGERTMSTTMCFVRILAKLLRDGQIGKNIVPIVPDEARTFGMDALFREYGIYSHVGQTYDPVDGESLFFYREAREGQLLEEGITEAGALSSLIAAGTAHITHGIGTLPFFVFYSMFGFQRVGDLIWAAGDMRTRGFLIGATAGRTTLNGEGPQHQDGHSHLLAYAYPNLAAYDPAYGYEVAVILQEGMRRMYDEKEDVIYYVTVQNENYHMPDMPEGAREGILKGMYRVREPGGGGQAQAHLFGSGSILNEAMRARQILEGDYGVPTQVWSVTGYRQLYEEGMDVERWNLLHPEEEPRAPYVSQCVAGSEGAFVMASDYVKAVPNSVARWMPHSPVVLGTDGYGRSDSRPALRRHFEISGETMAFAALSDLARQGKVEPRAVGEALGKLEIDPDAVNPVVA